VRFDSFKLLHLITPTRLAWSADSSRLIVFAGGASRLYMVSLADRTVNEFPVSDRVDLSWGADPRFAVIARPTQTAIRTGLEWLDTRSGRFSPLLSSESALSYPSVSPDGSSVAYTVGDTDFDVVEIPLDGSPIRPLLASRLPEHSVHFSPRSPEFAYTAAGQAEEIRIRQPATLAERVVVSRADFAQSPNPPRFVAAAFSPDGTKLAYNRGFEIWISPSNGGAPAKLTRESGEFGAEWSPDGAWLRSATRARSTPGWSRFVWGPAPRKSVCGGVSAAWRRRPGRPMARGSRAVGNRWDSIWFPQTAARRANSARSSSRSRCGPAMGIGCM
jgi:WD40-like Beta Propeller Repeat